MFSTTDKDADQVDGDLPSNQDAALNLNTMGELHSALFAAIADGVLVIDDQGLIVDCNPAFCRRLGYAKRELVDIRITAIGEPEYAARVPERLALAMRKGETTFESAYIRKDGSLLMVELNVRYLSVGGRNLFLGIARDITKRHQLETRLNEHNLIYQTAINTPALGFWMTDLQGRFLEVNDAYIRQSGYSREALLQMRIRDVEAVERPDDVSQHINLIIDRGYDRFRSEHRRSDGSVWPVEIVTSYSTIQGGRFFVFIEDITEKVIQENKLALASRVIDTIDQAVIVSDSDNHIVSINPAASRITGYSPQEVIGRDPNLLSSGMHGEDYYAAMWQSLNRKGQWEGEIWDRRKDGNVYAKWLTIKVIYDTQGRVYQYVSVFSDITERKKSEELIWKQANFDALTGLPNRHLFYEHLETEIRKAQRGGYQVAVFFIDLDRFKEVNDSLGHAKGDCLLAQAATRIRDFMRETDTIARLGGDEFTVVLADFGSRSNLERIVQGLIDLLAEPYDLDEDDTANVTASIGITLFPDDAGSLDEMLKHSDRAMYVAKSDGRNRFSYFTRSMQDDATMKLALTRDLRLALSQQQLEVYFQPIVDIKHSRVRRAEALLRWKHPTQGMISPSLFIPLAEEAGLIHEIGNWVFEQSISHIRNWRERFGFIIQVSINKSLVQMERTMQPCWSERIDDTGLPGNSINMEITEGTLLSQSKRIKNRLLALSSSDIEVSIDDFGTGFSALSYLQQYAINFLKIDRSIIADITTNPAHTALVEAIIVMAHGLGIRTIAKGVESREQFEMLVRFGCDFAQGYLFSRPLPADAFEQWVAQAEIAPSSGIR